jgi:branched-chain amino acid transport system permease protein
MLTRLKRGGPETAAAARDKPAAASAAGTAVAAAAAVAPAARRRRVLPIIELAVFAAFAVLPLALEEFWTTFATRVLILSLLAISFDLVWGYAGIMSFGQSLYFGAAGYLAALLARDLGITSLFVVLPAALLFGLVLSFLMAAFLLLGRTPPSSIFVAMGTLTGAYAADRLARSWYYLGGQNGIPSIPPMSVGDYAFYEGTAFYYLAFGFLLVVYLACRFLVRSQFGLALAGMREQERRIAFFGYKVQHLKAIVFSLAGAIAGLAGGLYAFHEGFVWPNILGVVLSTQIVLYALFGGTGTLVGAIIGVAVIEYVSFVLADLYPEIWPILLGVILLLVIMFRPTGLIGLLISERERTGTFGTIPVMPRRRNNVAA